MKLLFVHLSDAHITEPGTVLEERADRIVAAVRNLETDIDAAFVLLTGDIAYSGRDAEYVHAFSVVAKIVAGLSAGLKFRAGGPPIVEALAVPGNHDCDLSGDLDVRTVIADEVLKNQEKPITPSLVAACTGVQQNFFNFADTIMPGSAATTAGTPPRLATTRVVDVRGEKIQFVCLNTAWLSRNPEVQGTLHLPTQVLPVRVSSAALVVAMLHHPYNWLASPTSRTFRAALESLADFVFTGHEHESAKRATATDAGVSLTYFEGAVLHDSDEELPSAFNVLAVDTESRKQRYFVFEWNGELYRVVNGSSLSGAAFGVDWEEFRLNAVRKAGSFEINAEWQEFLDDPGVDLWHRRKARLSLADIFVFPELKRMEIPGSPPGPRVASEKVLDLVSRTPCLMISGDNLSGRTSLGKMVFRHLHAQGQVPIWIHGSDALPSDEHLGGFLERKFVKQYAEQALEHYRQLEPTRRVVIIDDFDQLPRSRRFAVLERLGKLAHRVVVFANDLALDVEQAVASERASPTDVSLDHYRIQPLGHLLRNRLVERWLEIEKPECETNEFAHRLDEITRLLTAIIGRNFVPPYPAYLLSVLQASESATAVDTRASTHGYFYEVFIKTALMRNRTRQQVDVLLSLLAMLAWDLHGRGAESIDEAGYRRVLRGYEETYAITVAHDGSLEELIKAGILVARGDGIRFKYDYMRHYFCAAYMRDHMGAPTVQERLSFLAQRLHIDEAANTLLFLVHLSKDPSILECLVRHASDLYKDHRVSDLQADVAFIGAMNVQALDVSYDSTKTREDGLVLEDEIEPERPSITHPARKGIWDEPIGDDDLSRINKAVKAIQILGQVLKNFPGSLEGPDKYALAKNCYDLGLRALTAVLDTMKGNESALGRDLASLIKMHSPNIREDELRRRAGAGVLAMALLVCLGIVKRVGVSVGACGLEQTYADVLGEHPTAGYSLIDVCIKLDHMGDFPEGIVKELGRAFDSWPVPKWVLKALVIENFRLFPVPYDVRQRICAALDISQLQPPRAQLMLVAKTPPPAAK